MARATPATMKNFPEIIDLRPEPAAASGVVGSARSSARRVGLVSVIAVELLRVVLTAGGANGRDVPRTAPQSARRRPGIDQSEMTSPPESSSSYSALHLSLSLSSASVS